MAVSSLDVQETAQAIAFSARRGLTFVSAFGVPLSLTRRWNSGGMLVKINQKRLDGCTLDCPL